MAPALSPRVSSNADENGVFEDGERSQTLYRLSSRLPPPPSLPAISKSPPTLLPHETTHQIRTRTHNPSPILNPEAALTCLPRGLSKGWQAADRAQSTGGYRCTSKKLAKVEAEFALEESVERFVDGETGNTPNGA
ncbi:hypothetical protein C0992_000133 [Termitomyces sp. T32_za158]|nr:hypothetical protein C0992_000133 [Termitomyces sp. T32_za158]